MTTRLCRTPSDNFSYAAIASSLSVSSGEEMPSNWEVDFFRGVALDFWRLAVPTEQTQAEVDFLRTELSASAGSHLLDVPCGLGRHSIALAKSGCRVTGLDSSSECIAEGRARAVGLPIDWVLGDMRQLEWTAEFDGGYCFGNSFGYLDPHDAPMFLAAVARAIKPGSRFVLETGMAAESILPGLQKTRWFRLGEIYMLSENQYRPREGRLDIQYTFVRDGVVETRPSSSYVFTVSELCRMFSQAGLQPVKLLGSVSGEPYQMGSPRLIVVAAKT
jgi:SAM-dependent methyltransferase